MGYARSVIELITGRKVKEVADKFVTGASQTQNAIVVIGLIAVGALIVSLFALSASAARPAAR